MPALILVEPALAQSEHAFLDCLALDLPGRSADQDQFLDLLGDFHHFVQADAALVAGSVAGLAALALEGLDVLGFLLA